MAAPVPLLLALISLIHAEFIHEAGWYHRFDLDASADFCSVYSWTGEEKELLWNSSGSYYELHPLRVSHSGLYLERCWSRGGLTLDRNATLLVCDTQKLNDPSTDFYPDVGQTVELTCDGVGPNQSIPWGYDLYSLDGLALIDNEMTPKYKHRLAKNKSSLLFTANKPSLSITYYCLEKNPHGCDLRGGFSVYVPPAFILRSVGESLELNCSDDSGNQTHVWRMYNSLRTHRENLNATPMLPSLTLDHTGRYACELGDSAREDYHLLVCPEPPVVELFTGGENLTLYCGDWNETDPRQSWFMRSDRTKGQVANVHKDGRPDNVHFSDRGLMISNVSVPDSGQFWCVVVKDNRCVFRAETQVKLREPALDHHLLRSVLLSAVMLMMLWFVVVAWAMVWRSREQLPAPVEEVEMSQLSPESDVQEETPV